MYEKLHIRQIFSYLENWQIPILIIIVMGFSFANFISSLAMLETEEEYIRSVELQSRLFLETEEAYHDFESLILRYHHIGNHIHDVDLEEILDAFDEFKQQFLEFEALYVPSANQDDISKVSAFKAVRFHREIDEYKQDKLEALQAVHQSLQQIEPLLTEALSDVHGEDYNAVNEYLYELYRHLKGISNYIENNSDDRFGLENLQKRHSQLLLSISLLFAACLAALIFSGIKNVQLQKHNKEHQKILAISERNMLALEASTDGIGIVDNEGNLAYMNKSFWDLHGIQDEDRDTYLNKPWVNLYNDLGRKQIYDAVYPILYSKGKWRGETEMARVDGEVINVEMSLTLLPNNQGLIGTGRDISARRMAEAERKELQDQIYQAQKMEAIGRLAGGIAHDFNNILAAINGYAEFLSEDLAEQDPKLKGFADSILKAGGKARGLIDQMLAFSRRKENVQTMIDLKSVVDETIFMLKASTPKTIEIMVDYQNDGPFFVMGDPYQITQALMNLCLNACDAIEDEHGELTISLMEIEPDEDTYGDMFRAEIPDESSVPRARIIDIESGHTYMELGAMTKGKNYFQLSVTDSGTGMTRAILEHIFEPFFTTKDVDKGTGLGMANVYGTLVSHQAAVSINTVVGKGTTFDLYFQKGEGALVKEDDLIVSNEDLKSLNHINVMLIDDEENVLEMTSKLLERANISYKAYLDPVEALEFLQSHDECPFDLVISDQNMPKITGLDLVKKVSEIFPDLPFIIVSGYSQEKLFEIQNSYPSIRKCLRKPVKKEDLINTIGSVFHEDA